MKASIIGTIGVLPLLATAFPTSAGPGEPVRNKRLGRQIHNANAQSGTITAEDIIKVAPVTASCAGRGSECVTAHQAAPAIAASFKKWGIISFGSQAAVVSTMLYESGNFEYDTPISPVPGKGTRNMQSAEYNEKYAQALGIANAGPDDVVTTLNQNVDTSFGSGAWFLASQCPMTTRDQMHAQEAEGYANYVQSCLGTSELTARQQIWDALLALKHW